MTTINANATRHRSRSGIWQRTTRALGKLWVKVLTLPNTDLAAARRQVPPSEYFMFPPY